MKILSILAFLFSITTLQAQQVLSLEDCIDYALKKNNQKILNHIQFLRGISVIIVFFYHLNLSYFDYGSNPINSVDNVSDKEVNFKLNNYSNFKRVQNRIKRNVNPRETAAKIIILKSEY